jgi:hypothetical protein
MTWEDAARKYSSHSPSPQELAMVSGRVLSPPDFNTILAPQDPMRMDLDPAPSQQPGRPPLSEARLRTPLPSGPRPDKPANITPLPSIDSLKFDLESSATRILANPYRSRYSAVQALLLYWHDDDDSTVRSTVLELAGLLESSYNYSIEVKSIPSVSEICKSPARWLSREIADFVDNGDQREILKIVYYNGHTYLDGERDMVLARY